jgi:hypothetical protein
MGPVAKYALMRKTASVGGLVVGFRAHHGANLSTLPGDHDLRAHSIGENANGLTDESR